MAPITDRPLPDLPGAEHRWVNVRGAQLHVAELGHGAPVVLLHGLAQHWYAWRKVAPMLSDDYRLICVDLRGFGWSEQTRRGYDIGNLASDVTALLDALELQRVSLLAHDFGADVAFRICLRAPERVESLVVLNMTHPWPKQRQLLPNLWRMWFTAFWEYPILGRWVLRHWPAFTRFLLRREVADTDGWHDADLDEFVEGTQHSARAEQSLLWQYILRDIPALIGRTRRHQRLAAPTLMLAGAKDPVIPPSLLAGADKHADRLEVRVIADTGHYLHEERPAIVAAAVRDIAHATTTDDPSFHMAATG